MIQIVSKRLLNHFGVKDFGTFWSTTCQNRYLDLEEAILDNQMVALCAPVGAGKTVLVNAVEDNLKGSVDFIRVRSCNKSQMVLGPILSKIIEDLAGEHVCRNLEARVTQFERIIGERLVNRKRKVCLVFEEAHHFRIDTFRGIKELREARFNNICPLFSVILIGHPKLHKMLTISAEIGYRTRFIELSEIDGWYDYPERINYLRSVFKGAITEAAREALAIEARFPLEINFCVNEAMIKAKKCGLTSVTLDVVDVSAKDLYESLKDSFGHRISYSLIADKVKELGGKIEKTTVSDVIHLGSQHRSYKIVQRAIKEIGKELRQEKESSEEEKFQQHLQKEQARTVKMECPNPECRSTNISTYGIKDKYPTVDYRFKICNDCGLRWLTQETYCRDVARQQKNQIDMFKKDGTNG